jgi:hypothetical protein
MNLLRLEALTMRDGYRRRAERALRSVGGRLERSPASFGEMLLAVDWWWDAPKEIVLIVPKAREEAEPFLARLRRMPALNRVLVVAREGEPISPLAEGKRALSGRATAYVCEKGVCRLPASDPEGFERQVRAR